jgi:hypothetical protein
MSSHDSDERPHSRWMGWALGLLAVPVLYVLTLPPLTHYLQYSAGYDNDFDALPPALRAYYLPGQWIYGRSPARKVLGYYSQWWGRMLRN